MYLVIFSEKVFQSLLDPEDYLDKLVEQASVSIVAVGKVARKGNRYTAEKMKKEHQVRFRRPDIKVEVCNCCPVVAKGQCYHKINKRL
jgi:hypothetical protein